VLGVSWRVRRTGSGSVVAEVIGGLNILAAALLCWLTAVFLFMASHNELNLPTEFLKWSAIAFCAVSCIVWVAYGMPPRTVASGKRGRLLLGHLLILVGTVAYGSVTFYLPVLIWLDLLPMEAGATLPWFAIFTLPAACLLWAIGFALIVSCGSNKRVQATRSEQRAPDA
jgi:hypothetical protein